MKPAVFKRTWLADTLFILLGVPIMSVAYTGFFVPNHIAPGGFTGAAMLFNALFNWPIGITAFIMNVPLFLISWRYLGKGVFFRSLVAMSLLSVMLDVIPSQPIATDPLLATVFGGVLQGLGIGMILRTTTTTGGADMAGSLLHRKLPQLNTAAWILLIDLLVIGVSAFVFDMTMALFAMIGAFTASRVNDWVLEGWGAAKAFTIITRKGPEVSARILSEIKHGVTHTQGKGMFTGEATDVLLCVVYRSDVVRLKRIVAQVDPKAFLILYNVTEAMGEGFHSTDLPS